MTASDVSDKSDVWSRWLKVRRDGGNHERLDGDLAALRDGVLARAAIRPGDTVLDVGCGTGLIGFGALDLVGPGGHVIFSDVSEDLLDGCREVAAGDPRCSFVQAAAEDLGAFDDCSVDVVALRSVLMYSAAKAIAVTEFFRVLRPGGRLTLFEPVNQFLLRHGPVRPFGLFDTPVDDLLDAIGEGFRESGAQERAYTQIEFDERDLMTLLIAAGFSAVDLDYRAQYHVPGRPIDDWAAMKRVAPNPLAPTFGEVIESSLSAADQVRLDAFMTSSPPPTVRTQAVAYLSAVRPF